MTLFYIILATLAVSLISFVGVLTLAISKKMLDKILLILVALAGGGLMGGAFLHLIPESLQALGEGQDATKIFVFVILGFLLFLLIEQYLHWHHHHCAKGETCEQDEHHHDAKPMSRLILFGDGVHNLIDGLVIAASFVVNPGVGLVTTMAVALHEIPQEIGDFGVLVYGGYKKGKALLFNFLSGLTAVL
ncbi:ZIP family metal transporter, partial [Patescibacteria group bacterium]|nr:ZIP family metal transporter [Patescibacteria group bacterium]